VARCRATRHLARPHDMPWVRCNATRRKSAVRGMCAAQRALRARAACISCTACPSSFASCDGSWFMLHVTLAHRITLYSVGCDRHDPRAERHNRTAWRPAHTTVRSAPPPPDATADGSQAPRACCPWLCVAACRFSLMRLEVALRASCTLLWYSSVCCCSAGV
jgi:hypothetical protein